MPVEAWTLPGLWSLLSLTAHGNLVLSPWRGPPGCLLEEMDTRPSYASPPLQQLAGRQTHRWAIFHHHHWSTCKSQIERKGIWVPTKGGSPDPGGGPQAPGPGLWLVSLPDGLAPGTLTLPRGAPWPLPGSLTPTREAVDFKTGANSAWRKTQNRPSPQSLWNQLEGLAWFVLQS